MNARRRALVVDDDISIRILVARILSRHDFTVDTARDGAEAIEKILQHDYDIVTLDLMMPRLDGEAVVRYLSDHQPALLPKVVMMTAYGAGAREKVCPPVMRFLDKPFEISTLIAEALACGSASPAVPQSG